MNAPDRSVFQDRGRAESFGTSAELYDALRPSYPDELIAWLSKSGLGRAADVGCGTGQVARLLSATGWKVTGVEIDERMAAVARSHDIDVVVSSFEEWEPTERFDLITSGQAWHWIDPDHGYRRAANLLRPGGGIGSAPELSLVPPLTTCVRNVDGIAAIVVLEDTGSETCADAGFAAWTGQSSVLDAGRALDNALVELGVDDPNPPTPEGCIDEATWQEQLRRSFDAEGLTNWTIDVTYNDSNPLCFRVMDLNPTTETIWLDQSQG